MIDLETLRRLAHDDCLRHAKNTFEGSFMIELGDEMQEWHPLELRYLFEQHMIVWREYGEFDVIFDESGHPVGYFDHSQWLDCQWRDLCHEEILAIMDAIGIISPPIAVTSMNRGQRDCLEAVIKQASNSTDSKTYRVQINPSRMKIISILPFEMPDD